ncbi:polysaccharide deacetylase family protein [Actinomadura violacea]|uniref:Polysaccharide deacetylase family protein n=1 Tax=Actinomadura violacea TaxID=2819934 RepID=A0ABS3RNQ6_9ACTN|nr:polysaccharide deacetylase family protein [Actinomadura violacea]MBO2458368.1 polysaccharide deacetylase family protein [Actinomadura violacea]
MTIQRRTVLTGMAGLAGAGLCAACGGGSRPDADASRGTGGPRTGAAAAARPVRSRPEEIMHGARDSRAVALTFHGSGDPALAQRLLREVNAAGAHITVMAVGQWLDEQPRMARSFLDGGHELGNHTQNHRDIDAMPAADSYAEIAQCAERLRKLTGTPGAWFRPSQAQHASPRVRAQAAALGYRGCLSYDVDSLDSTDPGASAVSSKVLHDVRGGSVVSMHLGHAGTVEALPAILDGLRGRGLRPVTVSELVKA